MVFVARISREEYCDQLINTCTSMDVTIADVRRIYEAVTLRNPMVTFVNPHNRLSPIHIACMNKGIEQGNRTEILEYLKMALGDNWDASDVSGQTPLMLATAKGNVVAMRWLIANGIDVNKSNLHGETALHYVIDTNAPLEAFELLVNAGADIQKKYQTKTSRREMTIFEYALERNAAYSPRIAKYKPVIRDVDADGLAHRVYDKERVVAALVGHDGLRTMVIDKKDHRPVVCVKNGVLEGLRELGATSPNFTEVIAHVTAQIQLAMVGKSKAVYLKPILINGTPGAGKTRFVRKLASVLGVDRVVIDYSILSAGFVVAGMSQSWSGASPGRIADYFVKGDTANPLVMLDELDKAGSSTQSDPLGPLYGLLERDQAAEFVDEFFSCKFDASKTIFIATTNNHHVLPEAILDRFEVFDVRDPVGEHRLAVVKNVYRELVKSESGAWGSAFEPEITDAVCEVLPQVSPRLIRKLLESAAGKVVAELDLVGGTAEPLLRIEPRHIDRARYSAKKSTWGFAVSDRG